MFRITKPFYPAYPVYPVRISLLEPDLQPSIAAVADRFGEKVFFLLQGHVDDTAFGRIEHAESKWPAAFADLIGGKTRHGVELSFSRLSKPIGIDDKAVFAVDLTAEGLKEDHFERVKQFAILGQCKMGVAAAKV